MLHALLYLLPAILLALSLLLRHYPGERALLALCARRRRRWPRPRRFAPARRPVRAAIRGGRLVASSLAARPPPATVLAV